MQNTLTNLTTHGLLQILALQFNTRKPLRSALMPRDPLSLRVAITTQQGGTAQSIIFSQGRAHIESGVARNADVVLRFQDNKALKSLLSSTPNEMLTLLLENRMILDGNLAALQLFNFLTALLLNPLHTERNAKKRKEKKRITERSFQPKQPLSSATFHARKLHGLRAQNKEAGVRYLSDSYLGHVTLEQFPRLKTFLHDHLHTMPRLGIERPLLLTEWYREHGFETQRDGTPWFPPRRQAEALRYLLLKRKPLIRDHALLAGTSTEHPVCGVLIYPDAHGTMLWGELKSLRDREINPYDVRETDLHSLHHDVFPFWMRRNFREWVREHYNYPPCLKLDERWLAYFVWKSVGISHTIPDFRRLLEKGAEGIQADIDARMQHASINATERDHLLAMHIMLDGLIGYANNLADSARRQARTERDAQRRQELLRMADACQQVPRKPARTLQEALQSLWITWIALHLENTNTGLSLGRLDQYLQPYFIADMETLQNNDARDAYVLQAIEYVGCFYMHLTDHLPMVPDLGNYLFGGSSSDQAITLGGVTPEGDDGVNDMTYILLKVTEMLCLRDPNVNARFNPHVNSTTYLQRLCEVNFTTAATPSMHNDLAVFKSLAQHGYPMEDIRDWAATGCVEPTLCGKHMGHTGSILMNMVAALELALHNGRHTHLDLPDLPRTGERFENFDAFFEAFSTQLEYLIEQATTLNSHLAEAHVALRPTPLLSSLLQGCIDNARDATEGGARYNSSGTANIGLADITDSLLIIKRLIFDENSLSFQQLKAALRNNFEGHAYLRAQAQNRVPLFGSGHPEGVAMANRVAQRVHQLYAARTDYRGGPYTTGFWSMSQHVAYGNLSGALPSGRAKGKAFTPGLTPQPWASCNFLDNLCDVARLDPENLDNNIAFNVKLTPSADDSREKTVQTMAAYVRTYFEMGGMQMQFNVVTADTLKHAMQHPEEYRNLLVRISGYNAYFVTLNRAMQIELIERADMGFNLFATRRTPHAERSARHPTRPRQV